MFFIFTTGSLKTLKKNSRNGVLQKGQSSDTLFLLWVQMKSNKTHKGLDKHTRCPWLLDFYLVN